MTEAERIKAAIEATTRAAFQAGVDAVRAGGAIPALLADLEKLIEKGTVMPDGNRNEMPMMTRIAPISSVNAEARTAEVVWSTGARVPRMDFWTGERFFEELSMDPAHIRMDRMRSGAPLLDSHNKHSFMGVHGDTRYGVIGVVENPVVANGEGRARVRFSERAEVEPVFRDVASGIIRNISAGYIVHKFEKSRDADGMVIMRAVDWEPAEVSLVPTGADAGAGVRSEQQQRTYPCEIIDRSVVDSPAANATTERSSTMTQATDTPAVAAAESAEAQRAAEALVQQRAAEAAGAERTRVRTIRDLCATHKLDRAFEDELINDDKCTVEQARAKVLDKLATQSEAVETRSAFGDVQTISDETVNRRAFIANALLHRANPSRVKLEEGARQWRGYTLRELMRKLLEVRGVRTEGMSVAQMWERTYLTGSDLPNIVLDAANKSLRMAYEATPRTFVPFCRRATAPDFKNMNRIMLSGAPSLVEVKPNGEFTRGVLTDGKESYALATYGKVVGINRQTIINDDLDAFTRLPELMARAAADLESDTVYGIITTNGTLSDGNALFGTAHSNFTTGAAQGTIDVNTLATGRQKLRAQTGLEGRPINLRPSFLIVPVAKESQAEQITSPNYQAAQASNINQFASGGRNPLVPIAEPRLDSNSAVAWYLAADPAQIDTIEYAYLEGEEGVYLESRMGFDVDGVELKARLDFAAKAIDYRGLYKSAGA